MHRFPGRATAALTILAVTLSIGTAAGEAEGKVPLAADAVAGRAAVAGTRLGLQSLFDEPSFDPPGAGGAGAWPAPTDPWDLAGARSTWRLGAEPLLAPARGGEPRRGWLVGGMNKWSWVATGVMSAGALALLFGDDDQRTEDVGDVTQIIPLLTGLGVSLGARDYRGLGQLGISFGVSFGTAHTLKVIAEKKRPSFGDDNSFPSAHTMASFAGAAFIDARYGHKWGAPMYVLAGYTGLSRVIGQAHFVDDVISGMSISLLSAMYFVKPIDESVSVSGLSVDDGFGAVVTIRDRNGPWTRAKRSEPKPPPPPKPGIFRYEWEFGPVNLDESLVRAPSDSGTTFSSLLDELNNPTWSGQVDLEWYGGDHHELTARLAPLEIREFGSVPYDIFFKDVTIPAGTEFYSRTLFYEYRLRYAYDFRPGRRFQLKAGGGLELQDVFIELADESLVELRDESVTDFVPVLYLYLGWAITPRATLLAEADGYYWDDDNELTDALLLFRWRFDEHWDIGGGARYTDNDARTGALQTRLTRTQLIVSFGYSF